MKTLVYTISIIPLIFVLSVSAAADETSVDDKAVEAFNRGKELFHAKKYAEAADSFREASKIKFSWKLLYNLGHAEAAAKRYGLALDAFERYLADGGDEVKPLRQLEVTREINRLKGMVGYLWIEGSKDAMVLVDEMQRGQLPLPGRIRISAGVMHHMVIRLEDQILVDRSVLLGSGETITIEAKSVHVKPGGVKPTEVEPVEEEPVEVEPVEAVESEQQSDSTEAAQDEVSPEADEPPQLRPVGWSLLGVGAATAIVGVITGASAISKSGELTNSCQDSVCTEDERETFQSGEKLATATDILLPVGALLAVTGLVLVIVGSKDEDEGSQPAVTLLPGPFGLSIEGSF